MKRLFFLTKIILLTSCFGYLNAQKQFNTYSGRLSFSMDPAFAPFYHGVASGDPLQDRVIIWSRVTPLGPVDSIYVEWTVATDTLFSNVVKQGSLYTNESKDYTVKIDVDGLQPNSYYYYYFRALDANSIIGRTKTAPEGNIDNIRFALVSGSNYNNGYYNVYNHIAQRNDFDAVIHLGDYIYEYGTDHYGSHPNRGLAPSHDCVTLSDYRIRHSHYRLDPDLRLLHQQYPWWVIWDDHETANDSYFDGAENHNPNTQGDWFQRKHAGIQAFIEWIPMREINDPTNPEKRISKTVKYGDLATLIFLDTRLEGRDNPNGLGVNDPNKTILGQHQYNWFTNELLNAQYIDTSQWKLIMQQVMFAPLNLVAYTNKDQWDGYKVERQKVLDFISYYQIKNSVILTGDIHTSWAIDVPNPNLGSYGANGQGVGTVEFVTPSVSSPSVSFGGGIGAGAVMLANSHIKWVDLINRGYLILDVSPEKTQSDWYFVNDINNHGGYNGYFAKAYYVNNLENFLREAPVPTLYNGAYQPFAPLFPSTTVAIDKPDLSRTYKDFVMLAAYPNPTVGEIDIQLFSYIDNQINISIKTIDGKDVYNENITVYPFDIYYHRLNVHHLPAGNYVLLVNSATGSHISKNIIKL